MKTLSGMGGFILATMMVGSLVLASCSGTPPSPATSDRPPEAKKSYGSLTIALDLREGIIDPAGEVGSTFYSISRAIIEALIRYDSEGGLIPELAERWEMAPDGLSHTFYIRKGVKFHNGDDLTGADVKFSIERNMAPTSRASRAGAWRSVVDRVELKDDYTVVLRLKGPQVELLTTIEDGMGGVVPKKYIEEKGADYFRKNPIGSGPFRVVRNELGIRVELEAVESHWRGVPQFKSITVLSIPEQATRIAMLKTGELDMAEVSTDAVASVKAAGLQVKSWNGGQRYYGFDLFDREHPDRYAIGDVRVRKAMFLALNRKELVDQLFGGYGTPSVLPATLGLKEDYNDPNVIKLDPYDPNEAKRLLTEAGYPNGFDTRILDNGGSGSPLSMLNEAMAGYWRKMGVRVETVRMELATSLSMITPKQKPEAWNSFWVFFGGVKRGFEEVRSKYHSTLSDRNKNPTLDSLLDKASAMASLAERKRLMVEAVGLARNEYTAPSYVDVYTIWAFGPKVGDFTPYWSTETGTLFESITHAK